MKKVRSKKGNLLNYFLYDSKYLSKEYIDSCNKFFKELKKINKGGSMIVKKKIENMEYNKNIPYGTVPQWDDEDIIMEDVEELILKNGTIKMEEIWKQKRPSIL